MNWDAIGATGEVLGAIVLIFTIAYLARQVSYARQATIDQNTLSRSNAVREMMLVVSQDEKLRMTVMDNYGAREFYEKLAEEQSVSVEEASQADWSNGYWYWVHWGQWASTHDANGLGELKHLIGAMYSIPRMRRSWNTSPWAKPMLDPKFVEFVDEVLAEHDRRAT